MSSNIEFLKNLTNVVGTIGVMTDPVEIEPFSHDESATKEYVTL